MRSISHRTAILLILGFSFYVALLGVINFGAYQRPIPAAIGIGVFLLAIAWAIAHGPKLTLPPELAIFSVSIAITVPILIFYAIGDVGAKSDSTDRYLIWFVLGIATLMGVLVMREQAKAGWLGFITMSVETVIIGGVQFAFDGLILGAVTLMITSQGASWALKSSERASKEFLTWALMVDTDRDALSEARAEARLRIRASLDSALPLLKMIDQKGGKLTASESKQVLLAEAGIRDQIRGAGLLDKNLVEAVLRARKRGLEVQLVDDGGTEQLQAEEKADITKKLVQNLDGLDSGKVILRSVAGEAWTVSFFAVDAGLDSPHIFIRF